MHTRNTRADPYHLERAYLEHLIRVSRRLDLRAAAGAGQTEDEHTALDLDAVYTALLTCTSRTDLDGHGRELPEGGRAERSPLSALEILDREPRLVLLGEAGSGKRTFLDFAALCLAGERLTRDHGLAGLPGLALLTASPPRADARPGVSPQPWRHGPLLPVRVTLRNLAADCPQPDGGLLWGHIVRTLGEKRADYAPVLRRHLLDRGGLILCDGLDEVPKGPDRCRVQASIEEFLDLFGACRVVVSSRTYAYRDDNWRPEGFAEAVLANLGQGQIRHFVRRWYAHGAARGVVPAARADGLASDLERAIFGRAPLLELAARPLLLTLIARLHQQGSGLPDARAALYESSVRLLQEDWERSRTVPGADGAPVRRPRLTEILNLDSGQLRGLLERLALAAQGRSSPHLLPGAGGGADIAARDLAAGLAALGEGRTEPGSQDLLLSLLRERSGILTRAPRDGYYRFPHPSFREYLAACALTGQPGAEREIAARVRAAPERWREVALLAATRSPSQGFGWRLANQLCPSQPSTSGRQGPDRTAARCAWVAGEILRESADLPGRLVGSDQDQARTLDVVRGWLVPLLSATTFPAPERAAIGRLLADLGDPRPDVIDPDAMAFCRVPAGPFLMGSDDDTLAYPDEKPRATQDLESGYWIARFPVTVAQFRVFAESAPGFAPGYLNCLHDPDNQPVRWINWHEALAFCDWLTRRWRDRLPPGSRVTLPSEAQWEKAARGGLRLPASVARPLAPGRGALPSAMEIGRASCRERV